MGIKIEIIYQGAAYLSFFHRIHGRSVFQITLLDRRSLCNVDSLRASVGKSLLADF